MSGNASKRAREIDRATTATALDRAYSDGQMTYEEHRLRIERAGAAVTLSDLRALTDDLQTDVDLPEPPPRHYEPKRRLLYALLAVIVVAVGLTVFLLDSPADDEPILAAVPTSSPTSSPTSVVEVADGVTPIVARPFDFDTAAGLDDFRQQYVDRYETSEVISVSIRLVDQRADIYRFDANRAVEDVSVDGGFDPRLYSSSSLDEAGTFEWMSIDHALVANLLAGVPESLGNPAAVVETISIDNQERPEIEFRTAESGRIVFDFAGNAIAVYK
ncbi:DUF1707 domain-containing protein [Rhodococcus sp. IEGM 1330]|uniref:DUF1707 SHOCT-like domain-containing protein n=1 Tax=Rhodococcus sp. IEGM 1330 TaxID=3082225 RepID=UPI002952D762|nr:DUF1707 domain-containing protein [Rhodococcus sp. IEGM 1330]MDV8021134.1 DUF1707 domain-containing protein [Rhodococcus sp. IEGM 1330]